MLALKFERDVDDRRARTGRGRAQCWPTGATNHSLPSPSNVSLRTLFVLCASSARAEEEGGAEGADEEEEEEDCADEADKALLFFSSFCLFVGFEPLDHSG